MITFIQWRFGLTVRALALMIIVIATQAGTVHAADDKKLKAQQDRIMKLQQAQQALELEKGQLQEDKADAEKLVKSARGELERVRAQARKDATQVTTLQSEVEALTTKLTLSEQALTNEREKLQALQRSHQQLQDQTRTSLQSTEQQLAERSKLLNTCEANNAGLYKLNIELLGLYEKSAASSGLLRLGSLTQLGRVKVENEMTACADKLEDLRVTPTKTQ